MSFFLLYHLANIICCLGCSALSSVTIPTSVLKIGYSAFASCGLTGLILPTSITLIESVGQIILDSCNRLNEAMCFILVEVFQQ